MFNIEKTYKENFQGLMQKLPTSINNFFILLLKKLFHEEQFNTIFTKDKHLKNLDFVSNMLSKLHIQYNVNPRELQNIPATGRLLIVANHITGASDAYSLVELISNARENKKVHTMVNGMIVEAFSQGKDILIPVDNINGSIPKSSLRKIHNALTNEEAVLIFPAGVVSRFTRNGLKDEPWKTSFLRIAKKYETPILPIKIDGRNSFLFYFLSAFLPKKITGLLLPHEFATAQKRPPLQFHIGEVIPQKAFSDKNISLETYTELFYTHLYRLGTREKPLLQTEKTIIPARNRIVLKNEIQNATFLGQTKDGKKIVLVEEENAPFLIQELGRVREISFRAIGGGTGTPRDNDLYDNYYKHLILWDDEDLEIVGAYRIGEVEKIIKNKGMQGLYTYNLCNFKDIFKEYYHNSVELGRSFVQPKYWGSRALDNLWQGVGAYLANNPRIVYTYGTVTINANTPKKAVSALVYFYLYHFSCKTNMMTAKHPYKLSDDEKEEFGIIFDGKSYKEGFVLLKKYLKQQGAVVPTLFKQYVELYEEGAVRFFDFSVNEELHGVVEGFIIADNSKMKQAKKERYCKGTQSREKSA